MVFEILNIIAFIAIIVSAIVFGISINSLLSAMKVSNLSQKALITALNDYNMTMNALSKTVKAQQETQTLILTEESKIKH